MNRSLPQHRNASFLAPETPGWQLHPRLQPLDGDVVLSKRHGNAFEETNLASELAARGVKSVVVAGLVSHGCVKATCLGAHARGYHVILASDGHSNWDQKAAGKIEIVNRELGATSIRVCPAAAIAF